MRPSPTNPRLATRRETSGVRGPVARAVLALVLLGAPAVARAAAPVVLDVKVIHAHNKSAVVDPRIAGIVKDLGALKYTGYELKDQATFNLEPKAVGRMRLPSGAWLTLTPLDVSDDKLRLELEVKELKFKTVVSIAKGATLAIGGPAYDQGALILAVTRKT